jgi:hypothetical protein
MQIAAALSSCQAILRTCQARGHGMIVVSRSWRTSSPSQSCG